MAEWVTVWDRASDRSRKKSQIMRDFHRQICEKDGRFRGNFLGKFRWRAIGFVVMLTFLTKKGANFAGF